MGVFERVRDYYQGIADTFQAVKTSSSVLRNATDAGDAREDKFMQFLRNHLPTRCQVIKGGFIFDSTGKESSQIDLIITHDLTIQFKQFSTNQKEGKSF